MTVKSSWAAGDVLAAADLTDTFADKNNNKNLLYNGAMQVAQRGTSTASITTGGYYTADRWNVGINLLGTWTQTVENDAPTGSGLRKSLKMLCTTANGSPAGAGIVNIRQLFEGQDLQRIAKGTASAQQLTLSFWVKSNVTGTYIAELFDHDNTRFVSASYTISASATWEKKSVTFPADTTGALDNDNALSLQVAFFLGAGSDFTSGTLGTSWHATNANRAVGQTNLAAATNNYWQVTGVQLEVGPVATSFEFESYGTVLQKCERYYRENRSYKAAKTASSYTQISWPLQTTMRALPTIYYQDSVGNASRVTTISAADVATNNRTAIAVAADDAATISILTNNTDTDVTVRFVARADAEL